MKILFSEEELYKISMVSYILVLLYHLLGSPMFGNERFPFVALIYAILFFYSFFQSKKNRWFYILIYICVLIILIATILVGSKNLTLILGGKLIIPIALISPFINLSNQLIGQERIVYSLGLMIMVMSIKMLKNANTKS